MIGQDNYDFSYSGLKTDVRREADTKKLTAARKADIAASFEAAAVDVLVAKTKRAALQYKPSAVLLGGGVAANQLLRERLTDVLGEENIRLLITPPELATDNAAMIGIAAYWMRDQALTGADRLSVSADPSAALASLAAPAAS
jgi:N6-L-threonylcarbamoyladenine synthase